MFIRTWPVFPNKTFIPQGRELRAELFPCINCCQLNLVAYAGRWLLRLTIHSGFISHTYLNYFPRLISNAHVAESSQLINWYPHGLSMNPAWPWLYVVDFPPYLYPECLWEMDQVSGPFQCRCAALGLKRVSSAGPSSTKPPPTQAMPSAAAAWDGGWRLNKERTCASWVWVLIN